MTTSTEASWTSMPIDIVTPPAKTPASSTTTVTRAIPMFCRITDAGRVARPTASGGSHGHADVRGGQGRGVVDAVADHGDGVAFFLQPRDHVQLVLGKQGSVDLVDAGGLADGLGHQPGVTGEHDHFLHAGLVEAGD